MPKYVVSGIALCPVTVEIEIEAVDSATAMCKVLSADRSLANAHDPNPKEWEQWCPTKVTVKS